MTHHRNIYVTDEYANALIAAASVIFEEDDYGDEYDELAEEFEELDAEEFEELLADDEDELCEEEEFDFDDEDWEEEEEGVVFIYPDGRITIVIFPDSNAETLLETDTYEN